MRSSLILLFGMLLAHGHADAQVASPAIGDRVGDYASIRTWHEQYLATSPTQQGRVEALRKIVRSGSLGDRGLQRIFHNFEGRMAIDPSIPGVEKTVRLLASSNRAQVKGHTRELLYAIGIHNDGRNSLIEMGRKLDRPWGKTDADIVLRNHRTGLYGRIEVKNYSLRSQITNEAKLKAQISKMAREARLTGQPQFWINRHGITPQLRRYAARSGILTLDKVGTGQRLPAGTQSFDQALATMDARFMRVAQRRAMAGGTMIGFGVGLLTESLPETWAAVQGLSDPKHSADWSQLGSAGSYSVAGTGMIVSSSALSFAPRFAEATQGRLYAFGKLGGAFSVAALGAGVAIDISRYRNGAISAEELWRRAAHASSVAAGGTTGAWLGGGITAIATANPALVAAGGIAGGFLGASIMTYAGAAVLDHKMEAARRRHDQAFGDSVYRRYGLASTQVTAPLGCWLPSYVSPRFSYPQGSGRPRGNG